jgi:hypothetical protein
MLRTKALASSIEEVPREWVFEHYLELHEKLTGQDVKMKSIFNSNDKKPSFFVFYSTTKRKYLFKDFSTDRAGDGTELVKEMFKLSTRGEAAHKIIDDYNNFVLSNGDQYKERVFQIQQRYKVAAVTPRNWTKLDQIFWSKFKIGSDILKFYNVQPLEDYKMTRDDGRELVISHPMIYGYFRKDGTLYKIYQPKSKENKFVKVADYIQGTDQLTFEKPYLVICSSLKDVMAFKKLGFNNAEAIAPDSENVLIPEHIIMGLKNKYKAICTLLDDDAAGIRSMRKYEEEYGIPYAHLKMEKDLSDSIRDHGVRNVRIHIFPVLTKALTGEARQL